MTDTAGATARQFHNRTKYVYVDSGQDAVDILMGEPPNLGQAFGEQDPALEPSPFKIYPDLQPIALPRRVLSTRIAALQAISASAFPSHGDAPAGLNQIGTLLLRTAGLLKEWTSPWGRRLHFRAAGCTGARYHLELYAVTGDLDGLDAGVYHYGPQDHSLRRLREGDFRSVVSEATGQAQAVAEAPVLLVCSSEFWRNAWRYQERAYRHAFWDLGTMATNLLALAASMNLPDTVLMGFADGQVNHLIGVDGEREAALALFALGKGSSSPPQGVECVPAIVPRVLPASAREIVFPDTQRVHRASSLETGDQAARWREHPLRRTLPSPQGHLIELTPLETAQLPDETVEEVIVRRRSNRHYAVDQPLSFAAFSTVLLRSTEPPPIDALDRAAPSLSDMYVIVNNVEGLAQGKYVLRRDLAAVELLEAGEFRESAAHLACGQEYAGDAHVNVYLMTDLDLVLDHYGDRGYRLAQFEAALTGGRLQLAAHALRLGAVGSTSADDDVTAFFSPHAAGKSFMFVAVFGNRRKPSDVETVDASKFLNRDR